MSSDQGSTIPAAKAAVVDLLLQAAWPAFPTPYMNGAGRPQIAYGEPKDLEQDRIVVGDTAGEPGEQEWFAFDASRREMFDLAVYITSTTPGQSCQEAVERCFALFTVFARTIRVAALADSKLGVAGVTNVQVRQPEHTETRTGEGWTVMVATAVRVEAQIAP